MPPLFFGWLIGFIGSLFIKVGEVIFDVMRAVGPWVQELVGVLRAVVNTMAVNIGAFFRAIVRGARWLADAAVSGWKALNTWLDRFREWLRRTFKPLLDAFKWINDVLDKVWSKVIAPILDVLEKIRLIFRFLDELGVSWAGAVARFIQSLETRIFETFRQVREIINTIETWIDLALDPRGWLRATPWLWTLYLYAGNTINILTRLGIDPHLKDRRLLQREQHEPRPIDATVERFKAGGFKEHFGVQQAAARFRAGRAGRL